MIKNTSNTYGSISRLFHWIIGIMIIIMLCVGFYMTDLAPSDQKWEIYGMHKATGVILLVLVILRMSWRLINIIPDLPNTMPTLHSVGYKLGVKLQYLFMFLMPSSGILMSLFAGKDIPIYGIFTIKAFEANKDLSTVCHTIHEYSSIALACAIGLHVSMALYHHFVVKDRLLMRMIVGK